MSEGGVRGEAVAISGSEFAESRRRILREAGNTFLVVDVSSRIRMAAGAPDLIGSSLGDVIDAPARVIDRAIASARRGTETVIPVSAGSLGPKGVRCLPVRSEPGKGAFVLVVVSDGRSADPGVEQLRRRADDLELLTRASSALARATESDSTKRLVCETALELAGADVVALLELNQEDGLVVAAATGPGLGGRSAPLDRSTMAEQALRSGEISFAHEVREDAGVWPLERAGTTTTAWQSVPPAAGARWMLAIGWRNSERPDPERMGWMLERLAAEAAVAIERAGALEQLTGLARTDPLTELSNRRAWQEELAREMAKAERGGLRLSVGLIDLDELKAFNDTWGHAAGDRVLLTAAARWRRRLRLTDLLARIGGDEFAVAIPGCALSEAAVLGDELRRALPEGLTCSIGVAEWAVGESAGELLARADEALYAAKNSGRDATFAIPGPAEAGTRGSVPSN
jgi:diguanylate cyclase (GGDEF)-like protein